MIHAALLILQLDPSYEGTGYALLNGRCEVLYSGTFRCTNEQASQQQRANEIAYHVGRFARTFPELTHIGTEKAVGSNSGACRPLDVLRGAICHALYLTHPHIEVQTMEVKEWRGAIDFKAPKCARSDKKKNEKLKAALMELARARWPTVPFTTSDPAEAALMGMRYLMHIHGTKPFPPPKPRKKRAAPASSAT